MVPPLVVVVVAVLLLLPVPCLCQCRISEFACHGGPQRCVPASRFCDGNDDCGDLSDEPHDCTNCNRTFYSEANVKHPLRMSSPYQRPLPFVCSMTFVAAGGEYGNVVQLTFLSFQIGALEMDNDSNPSCPKGYLQIVEPPAVTSALLSQQTRGFSQILSALKQPTEQLSSLFDTTRGNPEFGRLCGDMIGKSATFYTQGNNVTIKVVIPALHPFSFSVYLTYKYLTKETQPPSPSAGVPIPNPLQQPLQAEQQQQQSSHPTKNDDPRYYGNKVTNTYCDRVLVNCDRKRCAIRSPNFPGFYLRNITCHYWIRQEYVPHGKHAHIVLTQSNEYKISLYTGRSSPLSYPHVALTEECYSDVIRVFDGPSTASPLLIEFCGAGTLTEVISSSSEILVQLYSAPSQVMHNSYAELEVEVRFTEATEDYRTDRNGRCDFTVDGSKRRRGLLYSPRHTVPRNTTCTFRLQGATTHDRVWLYFLSYYVEDKHPWSRRETCEVGKLEIYEPYHEPSPTARKRGAVARLVAGDIQEDGSRGIHERTNNEPQTTKRGAAALLVTGDLEDGDKTSRMIHEWSNERTHEPPSYRFCEKTFPKVCARAADNPPNYVPVRPCKVPDESYLSRGAGLIIRHRSHSTPELPTWSSSSFTIRYEFVDTGQRGVPSGGPSPCDRRFDSLSGHVGSVDSPRDVFLFGRGGAKNISCRYEFIGAPGERIALTFTEIRLLGGASDHHCQHHYDPTVQRHTCRRTTTSSSRTSGGGDLDHATVEVLEWLTPGIRSPLACFCNLRSEARRPLAVESVASHVTVTFRVPEMSPFHDFEDFGFEAVYEFLPTSPLCEASIRRKNGSSEGEVIFQVPSTVEGRAMPLRCRWLLEAAPHKYLYLRLRGATTNSAEEDECRSGNKIIVYSSLPSLAPLSVVCLEGGAGSGRTASIAGAESASSSTGGLATGQAYREVDVFSNYWYNESADPQVLRDHVYIEVLANHAETVRFEWMEVTKPYPSRTRGGVISNRERGGACPFECPELNACIGAELWCDGRRHCPSGFDEAPAHCERFPTPYVVAGAAAGAVILLVILALVTLRCRRREEFKESRPVPTEDFPMDSPHV